MTSYELVPVADLDELPGNVNVMSDGEFNALCEGIRESGFIPPLVVAPRDGRWVVLDGNHRLRACRVLGIEQVPVMKVDLDETEQQEIMAARLNIVRGTIDRRLFTRLWNRITERMDTLTAMRTFGITSEERLKRLVISASRRVDAHVVVDDEVRAMMDRARFVEDLVSIVRAVVGDGGAGEFDYLVFQVRGSEIVLLRCSRAQLGQLKERFDKWRSEGISVSERVIQRLVV